MIRALMTKGVFLCHCQESEGKLHVGMMLLQKPGQRSVEVFDRDDESRTLMVELPEGDAIAMCDVTLRILDDEHSQAPG